MATYHRQYFSDHLHEFDLFIYGEDDIDIRLSTINTWLKETMRLDTLATRYQIGLVRYENPRMLFRNRQARERILKSSGNFTINPLSSRNSSLVVPNSRIAWEWNENSLYLTDNSSFPDLHQFGRYGSSYFLAFNHNNVDFPYAAASIYTRQQLLELEWKCVFLSEQRAEQLYASLPAVRLNEFYAGTQVFACGNQELISGSGIFNLSSPEFDCCVQWLLPTNGFESLFVHHIGTPGTSMDKNGLIGIVFIRQSI